MSVASPPASPAQPANIANSHTAAQNPLVIHQDRTATKAINGHLEH
jgi:hypothetical protein